MQSVVVDQLLPGRTYFIAMKTRDEVGNISSISNLLFVSLPDSEEVSKLPVVNVEASEHDGNLPENVVDGSFDTRWSAQSQGDLGSRTGQYLTLDLGGIYQVDYAKIAYYSGNIRQSFFDLRVSIDGEHWTDVLTDAESSGQTLDFETYELSGSIARYVQLVGYGNSSSGWNSVTEVEIYGKEAELPDITVGEVSFTDGNGDAIATLPESDLLQVHIPITNNKEEAQQATVLVVLYNEQMRVSKVAVITNTINAWGTEDYVAGLMMPEDPAGYKLKVFYWNNLHDMQAKMEAFTFLN